MAKTIVITGASRGIGAATARLCGARGWRVVVNYAANETAARETARAVEAAGGKSLIVSGDIATEADVVTLFDHAAGAFGAVDGVVNNAGVISRSMPFVEYDLDRIRRVFAVNCVGAFLVAREAARRMARSRGGPGGAIVNLSSAAARLGGPGEFIDYAATKGAIDTMTLGLARELGPEGIRVNAVRPGLIDTDMQAASGDPDRAARLAPGVPMRRAGAAEEVAEALVWLLSDAASYVTGAILDVTGGR